jgi:hypothetical protein
MFLPELVGEGHDGLLQFLPAHLPYWQKISHSASVRIYCSFLRLRG